MTEAPAHCTPYSALAGVYEAVMRDVPYAAWFAFVREHWRRPGLLLDLFSGPGPIARIATTYGFTAISLDHSFAMLRRSGGLRVQANALQLPLATGTASACTATNCSINYLRSQEELCGLFAECRRVLSSGGVLVLDYCPAERAWQLHNRRFVVPGAAVFFHSYNAKNALLISHVIVQSKSSTLTPLAPAVRAMEIHSQRIFSEKEIAESLRATGFVELVLTPNYGLPVPVGVSPIMTLVAQAG